MFENLQVEELDIHEISIGDYRAFDRTMTAEIVNQFALVSGDWSPLHVNDTYASSTRFGKRVVHGLLLQSHFSTMVGMLLPGTRALLQSI